MKALLIDIGNTRIKWRVDDPASVAALDASAVATADAGELARRWSAVAGDVEAAFVSNVAGAAIETAVVRMLRTRWPPIRIERVVPVRVGHGIVNGYVDPARLGPDRWLAMVGAHDLFPDRSLLVCSFGTATTIDLLTMASSRSDAATFVGGMILPGSDAMGQALARETARLPARRVTAVGFATDTEDAIGAGIAAAQAGAVERAYREAEHASGDAHVRCVVTGGAAVAIAPLLAVPYQPVPDLVLHGLSIVARGIDLDVGASTAA